MHYARLKKHKIILSMRNNEFVSVVNYNYQKPEETEISHRKFKDLCDFKKDNFNELSKKEEGVSPEITLHMYKILILAISMRCYYYDYNSNTMNRFSDLSNDHEGGSMVFVDQDSSIYIIGGKTTATVEKIKFSVADKKPSKSKWDIVCSLPGVRSNFVSFVVNGRIIYVALGYDQNAKKNICSCIKLDTNLNHKEWQTIQVDESTVPKLSFASAIHFCDGGVFILGGLKNYHESNSLVYLFSYTTGIWTTTEFIIQEAPYEEEPINSENSNNLNNKQSNKYKLPSCKFSSSCQFLPLKFNVNDSLNSFFYALTDNANFCHLINVRSFDHYFLYQNDIVAYNETEEEENEKSEGSIGSNAKSVKSIKSKEKDVKQQQEEVDLEDIEDRDGNDDLDFHFKDDVEDEFDGGEKKSNFLNVQSIK